jgi:hypothetical protein
MSQPMAAVSLVHRTVQRRRLPAFVRYPLAVVTGAITGEAIGLPVAFLLDLAFGANVTGGRWPLTTANVILICVKSVATGYTAGWIAQKRGKLMGALADFFPFFCFLLFLIIVFVITGRVLD